MSLSKKSKDQKLEERKQTWSRSLVYEKGELNFYCAIETDRIDIMEEHFQKNPSLKLNVNRHYAPNFIIPCPLITAVKSQSRKALECLLKHDADPDYICEKMRMSPLEYARKHDHVSYTMILNHKKDKENHS